MRAVALCVAAVRLAAAALLAGGAVQAAPLPVLKIEPGQTTVSGLSSGGYMAVQLHVAYSATFAKGAAIVAGGPFNCAEGSLSKATGRCMAHDAAIPVATLVGTTRQWATSGFIDPVANLASSRVYLFSGSSDPTVKPAVMNELEAYYRAFVPAAQIAFRRDVAAGHAMVTDDQGSTCSTTGTPFINDCDVDLAGELLAHLYGPLAARNGGALSGAFVEFDQTAFASGHGLAATGWAYVPAACTAASACRLHVALHGCRQNTAAVGQDFVRKTGYNRWADTNRIVVLYPQTGSGAINGCWDWWGYDSADYAKKTGPQMAAVKAMVDRVSGAPPAPASCFTASNYAHTTAGRAYAAWWWTYAKGSNEAMGFWSIFSNTTLKQARPGHYVVGTC